MEAAAAMSDALAVDAVHVRYGGVAALAGVSLRAEPGTVHGLIGPNGAGKTTLLNAVTGVVRATAGTVSLGAARLDGLAPHRVARAGVARTYQSIRLFAALSVADNLRAGALRLSRAPNDAELRALLERAGIGDVALDARAGALPYGAQRRLEIGRALAAEPAALLLDEPAAGMNPSETRDLGRLIRSVAEGGTAVLLVEHDMALVAAVCDRVTVLNFGEVIAEGTHAEVARDAAVVEAYLGSASA
jgi:ABC-type branched-subunit amino acid transport system ATPase component